MGQEERRGVLVHVVEIGPEFDVGDAPRDLELAPAMGGPAEHAQAIRNSELPMTISPLVPMSMYRLIASESVARLAHSRPALMSPPT